MPFRALAAVLLLPLSSPAAAESTRAARELVGLWKARHDFGPEARGTLVLEKTASGWRADFRGRRIAVREDDGVLTFEMPDRQGGFRARLRPDGLASGQWFQPVSPANPPFGTGINFEPDGPNRWRGEVLPLDDTSTFYLMLRERADGLLGAFLRHREFNLGVRYNFDRLVQDRAGVRLIGRLPGESVERVLLSGSLDPENGVLSLAFEPPLDGVYDFTRAGDESYFYPRGRTPGRLNGIKCGYLWWGIDWPYKNRVVHAFFAGGNGGQGVLVVPELDLVVATNGSNYASRLGLEIQQGLMPRFILPAVREAGDAKDSRVVPREYTVIYV